MVLQGHSHDIWSGTVAVRGDAAKGSGIELCSTNHSARSMENFSPSVLSYQDALSWHLRALKTRKCRFQTIWSHRSLALSTVAMWLPTTRLGAPWILAEMWLLPQKVVGLKPTDPINLSGIYGPVLKGGPTRPRTPLLGFAISKTIFSCNLPESGLELPSLHVQSRCSAFYIAFVLLPEYFT